MISLFSDNKLCSISITLHTEISQTTSNPESSNHLTDSIQFNSQNLLPNMASQEPVQVFLYANDQRPVLVFDTAEHATTFINALERNGGHADRYYNPKDVYLRKPHGLEHVSAGPKGQLAFQFHTEEQAQHWVEQLVGFGTLQESSGDTNAAKRIVLLGGAKSA